LPPHTAASRKYYPALDGLRGLAILLVVFYHNFGFINYFFFGWLGVDLFFVLSGFLITGILVETAGRPGFLNGFFARRVLRIFPLYFLVLIIFLLLLPQWKHNPLQLEYYTEHQFWLWTYMQNWLFIVEPPPPSALSLTHLWSLAVEEQFYLLWPFAILLFRNPRTLFYIMLGLLLLVLAGRLAIWIFRIEQLAYFNLYTFSRIDGICIGSMLALLVQFHPGFLKKYTSLLVFALAGLNFLFFFINRAYGFSFPFLAIIGYTTFAVLFGLLVHEAVQSRNRIIEILFNNGFMRFFGKISYGFYVFHWPVYMLLMPHLVRMLGEQQSLGTRGVQITASVLATGAGLAISVLSYYFFEMHFLRLKKYFN